MPPQMTTFTCRYCGLVERARGNAAWHPCPQRPTKTGRPQMVEMEGEEQ